MEKELQKEFSEQIAKDLRKSAFREYANAAFDASKVPEVEMLRENKTEELDGFRKDLEGIERDPENHKREWREKAKALKAQIATAEQFVKDCNLTISRIQQTVQSQRQKAAQYLERATFLEQFNLDGHAN